MELWAFFFGFGPIVTSSFLNMAAITEGQVRVMNAALAGEDRGPHKHFAGGANTPVFKATGKPNIVEAVVLNKSGDVIQQSSSSGRGQTFELTLPVTTVTTGKYLGVESQLKWHRLSKSGSKEVRAPTQALTVSLNPTDPRVKSSLAGLDVFKTFGLDMLVAQWFVAQYAPTSTLKKQLGDEEKYTETMKGMLLDTGTAPFGCISEADDGSFLLTARSKIAPYAGETLPENQAIIDACPITSELPMFAEDTKDTRKQFVKLIEVDGSEVTPEDYCDRAETICAPGSLVVMTIMVFFGGINTYEGKQSFKPKLVSVQAVESADSAQLNRGPTNLLNALAQYELKREAEEPKEEDGNAKKKKKAK
jgi:hypothetical protein